VGKLGLDSHLAHAACCLLFILSLSKSKNKNALESDIMGIKK